MVANIEGCSWRIRTSCTGGGGGGSLRLRRFGGAGGSVGGGSAAWKRFGTISLKTFCSARCNRSATLSLLRRVDRALYANHGMHAECGKETIEHLIRLHAGHDLNHLTQIEALLRS